MVEENKELREEITINLEELESALNEEVDEVRVSPNLEGVSTATVYLAAPKSFFTVAITGADRNLGKWKEPCGKFEVFKTAGEVCIYKGIVPVPSVERTPFKFILVDDSGDAIFEGEDEKDNRFDELLPDSVNFFILKPQPEGVLKSIYKKLKSAILRQPKIERKIYSEFIKIIYDRALQDASQGWDTSFESLCDGLSKVTNQRKDDINELFSQFLDQQSTKEQIGNNLYGILLLFTGAFILDCKTKTLGKLLEDKIKEISLLLFNTWRTIKRHPNEYAKVLENISSYNPGLSWIVVRQNRTETLKRPTDVSQALITTLNEIEEVLHDPNMLSIQRTIGYLVLHNNIDHLYRELEPFFNANNNNRVHIEDLFLFHLKVFKGNEEKTIEILRSDFLKQIFERIQSSPTSSGSYPTSDHLLKFLLFMLDLDIRTLIVLGDYMPDYIRRFGFPIIETLITAKLQKVQSFNEKDYEFFGKLDINTLNPYPQSRLKIELILLRMTDELLSEGQFDKIPSVPLMLTGLSRREDIVYLQRPSVADLREILSNQSRHFFAGLNSALQPKGQSIEGTLKAYQTRGLRPLCEQIQDHFDHIETILGDVKEQRIPLCDVSHLLVIS